MIEWYHDWETANALYYRDIPSFYQVERRKEMSNKISIMNHNGLNAHKGTSSTTNSGKPVKK